MVLATLRLGWPGQSRRYRISPVEAEAALWGGNPKGANQMDRNVADIRANGGPGVFPVVNNLQVACN